MLTRLSRSSVELYVSTLRPKVLNFKPLPSFWSLLWDDIWKYAPMIITQTLGNICHWPEVLVNYAI